MTTSPAHPQSDSLARRLRAGGGAALARLADATHARTLAVAWALAQVGRALAPTPASRPWTARVRGALHDALDAARDQLRARRAAARARCPGLA